MTRSRLFCRLLLAFFVLAFVCFRASQSQQIEKPGKAVPMADDAVSDKATGLSSQDTDTDDQSRRRREAQADEEYEAPVLTRGLGVTSDGVGGTPTESRQSPPRRRYPDRSYDDDRGGQRTYDPGSAFRDGGGGGGGGGGGDGSFSYDPYPPRSSKGQGQSYPTRNLSNPAPRTPPRSTTTLRPTPTPGPAPRSMGGGRGGTERDPFDDPNRYRLPQQQEARDDVRFVNGRPYREPPNIQDRYGNRYDPRFHSIPGQYDPENDPRFSDPRYQDPRNVPKYNNNRQRVPQDRYDSKYRYYERFPDRQRDRLLDPNYDPRYDPEDPPVPGVLGGWLPELQGECRPGCENLPRDVTINTNYGRVNGFLVYLYDGPRVSEYDRPGVANVDKVKAKVSVFLGVPYAQAPIGEARLMPPRPHRGWQSYDAVDWAPVCPQPVRFVGATKNAPLMDEDCLYLNIYTPTVQSGHSQLFPVMFYIHGGEFVRGSGNAFPGHQLAAWGRVVVVTVNYRLGALGFLSTGDHHAPGNYGLLDQAMALKWVYDNVDSFQGDRERITVFGPGAGAASAGLLAVMPRSRSMVSRVIAISGSPLADWASIGDKFRAMNTSRVFGERVGCTIDNSWKLVDCIRRGRSFGELTNVEFKPEIGTWPWAPVVQVNISVPDDSWYEEWTSDDFVALPELVDVLYQNQAYNSKLKYMTGVARDDASYLLYENKTLAPSYDIGWDFFDTMVRDHIKQYNYTLNPEGIFNAVKYMYTYWPDQNNRSHIREEFINFWSDYYFRAPQDAIVKTLVHNRVDTYMYVQNTTVEALRLPWWRQITHNLEHYFLTGAPFMDPVFFPEDQQVSRHLWTEGDRNMSEFFIYAVSNFSWYGDPTPKNILGVHWDMAKKGEILQYLAVNTTENSTTLWNYRQRECAFWTEYLPSVIGYITPTYPPTTEFWWEPDSPLQIAFWSQSSICLLLLVLLVVFCLLWRNAKSQAKDRYGWADAGMGAGSDSLRDFPVNDYKSEHLVAPGSTLAMDTLPKQHMDLTDVDSVHRNGAGGTGSVLGSLPPQTPILQQQQTPVNGSLAGGLSNAPTLQMGMFPSQQTLGPQQAPLVPQHQPLLQQQSHGTLPQSHGTLPQTGYLPQSYSQQSFPQQQQQQQQFDESTLPRQQTQPSPAPSRRQVPLPQNELSSTDWSDGPPPQPMGLPKTQGKLVPGRMSGQSSQQQQQQQPQSLSRSNSQHKISSISSTAV